MLVFADLYLTIRNPFFSQWARAKREYILLFVFSVVVASSLVYFSDEGEIAYNLFNIYLPSVLAMLICIFGMLTICRLVKTGTSKKLRRKIIGRNATQLLLNILIVITNYF